MKLHALILAGLACASGLSAAAVISHTSRFDQRAAQAASLQRAWLSPRFAPGQVLRYQLDFRTSTDGEQSGVVEDPQAAAQMDVSWSAILRVEVLSVVPVGTPAAPAANPLVATVRLRTTYEKSVAIVHSDSYDPEAASIESQYRKLEGHSIEFTVGPSGTISDISGLKQIAADENVAEAARQMLAQIAGGVSAPSAPVVPGGKWTSERPAPAGPIAGLIWRTESNYLRDEPCHVGLLATPGVEAGGEECAVILTRVEITQPDLKRDTTPEEYRSRGLHTAGRWSGLGESLSYISLQNGWAVSVTQTGTEQMDFTVTSLDAQTTMRYAGRVRTRSQITLLPPIPSSHH